jgi:CTP:molybdopterin cytidylyltransferase MocA
MTVAGLVLAAGAGTRFGQPKAPVVVDGERLVDRAVRVLAEGGCDPVIVVLGAWVGHVEGADIVLNDEWPEGMGSSLRAGLRAAAELGDVESAVVTLVDLPGLTAEAVRRIADAPAEALVVQATYDGERGHPVRIRRELWPEAIAVARGDEGARRLLRGRDDIVLVEVGDLARGYDVDTPADTASE